MLLPENEKRRLYGDIIQAYIGETADSIIERLKHKGNPLGADYYYLENGWQACCHELRKEKLTEIGLYYVNYIDYYAKPRYDLLGNDVLKAAYGSDSWRSMFRRDVLYTIKTFAIREILPGPLPEQYLEDFKKRVLEDIKSTLESVGPLFIDGRNNCYEEYCQEVQDGDGILDPDMFYEYLNDIIDLSILNELEAYGEQKQLIRAALWLDASYDYRTNYNYAEDYYTGDYPRAGLRAYFYVLLREEAEAYPLKSLWEADEEDDYDEDEDYIDDEDYDKVENYIDDEDYDVAEDEAAK